MEFFRIQKDIPFMKHALVFNVISLVTFLLAVIFLATRGLHFSVEFTGGTLVEVGHAEAPDAAKVRDTPTAHGFAHAQRVRTAEPHHRRVLQRDLEYREVGVRVGADDACRRGTAVLELDLDLARAGDPMIVRDDMACGGGDMKCWATSGREILAKT